MNLQALYILPTHGARTYKGKYPERARSISGSKGVWHFELNNGDRYVCGTALLKQFGWDNVPRLNDDFGSIARIACPLDVAGYNELKQALAAR